MKKGQATVGLNGIPFKARHLRGQAAVEYLITYSWAILGLIIVIAALIGGGLLSSSYFISEQCDLSFNLPCSAQLYTEDGNFNMVMKITNGFGYEIELKNIEMNVSESIGKTEDISKKLKSGEFVEVTMDITSNQIEVEPNMMMAIPISVKYVNCAHEINPGCTKPLEAHTISGRIIGRVTAQN